MDSNLSVIVESSEAEKLMREHPEEAIKLIGSRVQRLSLSDDDKEDLVMRIFTVLLERKIKDYQPVSKLSTWITNVANLEITNWLKKYRMDRKKGSGHELNEYREPSHSMSPLKIAMLNEIKEAIENEKHGKLRAALQGKFYHDLTLVEIADNIGMSKAWVQKEISKWIERKRSDLEVTV